MGKGPACPGADGECPGRATIAAAASTARMTSFDGQTRKCLSRLTLPEKIGRMTQADQMYLHDLDDLQKYHLG